MKSFFDCPFEDISIRYSNHFTLKEITPFKKIFLLSSGLTCSRDKKTTTQFLLFKHFSNPRNKTLSSINKLNEFKTEYKLFQKYHESFFNANSQGFTCTELLLRGYHNSINPNQDLFIILNRMDSDTSIGIKFPITQILTSALVRESSQLNTTKQCLCLAILINQLNQEEYLNYCRPDISDSINYFASLDRFKLSKY